MNENGVETTTVEETGGFIDDMGVDMSEYMTGGGEDQPDETEIVADEPDEGAETEPAAETKPAEEQKSTGSDGASDGVKIPVKVLGEQRDLTVAEATEYAQKGMDYDRVKGQLHKANEELQELRQFKSNNSDSIAFLEQLARESNMTLEAMIEDVKVGQLMKKEKISREVAVERVRSEKLRQQLERRNEAQRKETEADARRKADISEFLQKFPGVNGKDIPKEVWDKVNGGDTLVHAYEAHVSAKRDAEKDKKIADLERELATLKQNTANKARSTGSQRTGGQESSRDQFLDIFLSDD